jgi:DNA-binding FadR family transcriptional regulator
MVAAALRKRIVSGAIEDGGMLPKQEDLMAEFGISLPPMREALRILETEGLITVRRGNTGGAVVHQPQATKAAYMLGLVLQSRDVAINDVLSALRRLEPVCAAACAARPDRETAVLPRLRATLDAAKDAIEDGVEYTRLARQFHADLVACCGNETMILVIGALESLWSAHVEESRGQLRLGSFGDIEVRRISAKEHEVLYRQIAEGNERGAEKAVRDHLSEEGHGDDKGWRHDVDVDSVVDAAVVRDARDE